jgi:hypothetical protein
VNPVAKEKWLAKLRDPNAEQTVGKLGDPSGARCCLGVLCDVAVEEGVIPAPTRPSGVSGDFLYYGRGMSAGLLPNEVREWAGLEYRDPTVANRTLSQHNDNGMPFAQIADLIEEEL